MRDELPERYFFKKNNFVQVGQVLKSLFAGKKNTDRAGQQVRNVWHSIVDKDTYQQTKVTGLKNGILYVSVESAAMIHHLTSFGKNAIISRINEVVKDEYVKDIRFKVGILNDNK